MVEIGKNFEYAKKSVLGYVGIWVAVTILGFVPVLNIIGALLGMVQFWVVNPLLLAYAGHAAGKATKGSLADGAVAGALAGFAGSAIVAVLTMLLTVLGVGAAAGQGDALDTGMGALATGIIGIAQLVMVVVVTVAGAVLGLIGAAIAGSGKK